MIALGTSLGIIWSSIKSTLGNLRNVIRDLWLAMLPICLASGLLAYHDIKRVLFPSDVQVFQVVANDEGAQQVSFASSEVLFAALPIVSLILVVLGIVLLAILWHRREILHNQTLGGAKTVFSYASFALPIGLIATTSLVLPSILLGYFSELWTILSWAVALYLMFRLSPALPAVAIGRKIGFSDAWRSTRGLALACFFLALFRLGLSLVAGAMDALLFQQGIPWGIIILGTILLAVFEALISIALVTQLYIVAFNAKTVE